jgi:hypothetical protein
MEGNKDVDGVSSEFDFLFSPKNHIDLFIRIKDGSGTVIHIYNPSYLGVRDWEDLGSRSAWVKN